MNQILLTNNENIKRKSSNKYNGNNSSGDMKKIIIFFSIAILIFAIAIIGVYAYKMTKKDEEKPIGKPKLSLEQTENQVKIIAKAEVGIDEIIYKWNDEESIKEKMNGRTSHEEALEIPEGQNTLKVIVIDLNGEQIETKKEFYIEETKKITIELDEKIGNGKVKITATDETDFVKYITYKWNEEEEVTVEAEEENQTSIETIIDIKRGKNTLTVTAVNGLAKTETIDRIFEGVNNPVIEVTRDANTLYMRVTHDMGFEKITYTINGQEYIYDENFSEYNAEEKEIAYKFDLIEGENTVIIHAISTEKTEEIYKGKCNYATE